MYTCIYIYIYVDIVEALSSPSPRRGPGRWSCRRAPARGAARRSRPYIYIYIYVYIYIYNYYYYYHYYYYPGELRLPEVQVVVAQVEEGGVLRVQRAAGGCVEDLI